MSTEQVGSHEAKDRADNRKSPYSEAFKKFIVSGWAPYSEVPPERLAAADWIPARWASLREAFPGATLVIPAGPYKVRSNDCDYRFRPHSTFAWVTGLGEDREPDAVAVVSPDDVLLYFRPRCPRTDEEFYASSRYGEMWVGQRDSLEEMAARVGFPCRDLHQLRDELSGIVGLRVVREADPEITSMVDELRGGQAQDAAVTVARGRVPGSGQFHLRVRVAGLMQSGVRKGDAVIDPPVGASRVRAGGEHVGEGTINGGRVAGRHLAQRPRDPQPAGWQHGAPQRRPPAHPLLHRHGEHPAPVGDQRQRRVELLAVTDQVGVRPGVRRSEDVVEHGPSLAGSRLALSSQNR